MIEASRYFTYYVLFSCQEMRALLAALQPLSIYDISQLTDGSALPEAEFLARYQACLEGAEFSACVFTADPAAVTSLEVRPGRFLHRPLRPVLSLRSNHYSTTSGKPMVYGKGSLPWGLEYAFPQLYRDEETKQVIETLKTPSPNLELFKKLKHFVRAHSRPAKLSIGGKIITSPLRQGVLHV